MELLNNILSTLMGKNFTLDTMTTTGTALAYMYTLKKAVQDEIRGIAVKCMLLNMFERLLETEKMSISRVDNHKFFLTLELYGDT